MINFFQTSFNFLLVYALGTFRILCVLSRSADQDIKNCACKRGLNFKILVSNCGQTNVPAHPHLPLAVTDPFDRDLQVDWCRRGDLRCVPKCSGPLFTSLRPIYFVGCKFLRIEYFLETVPKQLICYTLKNILFVKIKELTKVVRIDFNLNWF